MAASRLVRPCLLVLLWQLAGSSPSQHHHTRMGSCSSSANPEQKMAAKSFVDNAIRDNRVMVFSKSYCPYCKKAKAALTSVMPPEKFTVVELDQRQDGSDLQNYLLDITGGRSVPRVFIDGTFIGGGDDTEQLAASGELKRMLASKGII